MSQKGHFSYKRRSPFQKGGNTHLIIDSSNTDSSFTMANSNSFSESLRNSFDSSRKQIVRDFILFYDDIVCCVIFLESHR